MSTVRVFDPPMCCSSGVCGADPDVALARFAADVQWLQVQGVVVERFTLSREPGRFATEPVVVQALRSGGTGALPIVMVNDRVVAEGRYPDRQQLAVDLGLIGATGARAPTAGGRGCTPGSCC